MSVMQYPNCNQYDPLRMKYMPKEGAARQRASGGALAIWRMKLTAAKAVPIQKKRNNTDCVPLCHTSGEKQRHMGLYRIPKQA